MSSVIYAKPPTRVSSPNAAGNQKLAGYVLYALLLLMTLGPLLALGNDTHYTGDGNPIRQFGYIGIYCMSVAAIGSKANIRRLFVLPLSLTLVFLWCAFTLRFSVSPAIGARRLLLTLVIAMTIFSMTQIGGYERTIVIVKRVLLWTLVANWVMVVFLPQIGIHQTAEVAGFGSSPDIVGAWKGIVAHKNFAGSLCALTILLYALDKGTMSLWGRFLVIVFSGVFLLGSHSKTSGALVVVAVCVGLIYRNIESRFRTQSIAAILGLMLAVAIAVYVKRDAIMAFVRSPDGLTGRTAIWNVLLRYWSDHAHPAGFGSFWNIGSEILMLHYVKPKSWLAGVPEAHDGYIDLLVQIGIPGLILTVLALVAIPVFRLVWSPTVSRTNGAVALAIVLFCAAHNFAESSFLDRDQIIDVFLFLGVALSGVLTSPATSSQPAYRIWRLKDPSLA